MKKALSLILALVLCLSLCACGGNNSNRIVLTKDNIETYFKLNAGLYDNGNYGMGNEPNEFHAWAKVEAVSTNFNYEDIKITFRVKRNARCCKFNLGPDIPASQSVLYDHEIPCDAEITITTNIAGNGEEKIPLDYICQEHSQTPYFLRDSDISWEIVSVSGYVVPIQ